MAVNTIYLELGDDLFKMDTSVVEQWKEVYKIARECQHEIFTNGSLWKDCMFKVHSI